MYFILFIFLFLNEIKKKISLLQNKSFYEKKSWAILNALRLEKEIRYKFLHRLDCGLSSLWSSILVIWQLLPRKWILFDNATGGSCWSIWTLCLQAITVWNPLWRYILIWFDLIWWTKSGCPSLPIIINSFWWFVALIFPSAEVDEWEIAPRFSDLLSNTTVQFFKDRVQSLHPTDHLGMDGAAVSQSAGIVLLESGLLIEYDW